ncbi:MAG: diguanylate cyclase [Halothiobacillaceae bacterium]
MRPFLILVFLAGLGLALPVQADKQEEPLTVAISSGWPPLCYLNDSGEPEGVLIELWREVGRVLDRPVQFELVGWAESLRLVRVGVADVHGGLFHSQIRAGYLDFSTPLLPSETLVFVQSRLPVFGMDELGGHALGVIDGGYGMEFLQENHPGVRIRLFPDNESQVRAAVDGEIDGFVAEYPVGLYLIDRYADPAAFRPLALLHSHPLRAGVRKGNTALLAEIDRALAQIGTERLNALGQRWFQVERVEVIPAWVGWALAVALGLVLIGAVSLWQGLRRRQLAQAALDRQAALEESEGLLRSLGRNAAAGIYIIRGSKFLAVNPAMSQILEASEHELLTRDFIEFVHPIDRGMVGKRALARLRGEQVPNQYEIRLLTGEGQMRWAELHADVAEYRGERVSLGTLYDITDRKRLEDRLRTSEARFRTLVENAPDIIFTLSASGEFLFVSPNIRQIMGFEPEELIGEPMSFVVHPDDLAHCGAFMHEVLETGAQERSVEYRVRIKSGGWRWHVSNTGTLVRDGEVEFIGMARDVTDTREAVAEVRYQNRFKQLLVELSGEFLSAGGLTLDEKINQMLERAGRFFEVDRAYLFEFADNNTAMINTHEWTAEAVQPAIAQWHRMEIADFPQAAEELIGTLLAGKAFRLSDIADLPESATAERALLEAQDVRSVFCVPLYSGGEVTGFFGLDRNDDAAWRHDQADLMMVLANLLSEAMARHALEDELRDNAMTDGLTGLKNRRYLFARMEELFEEYRRHGREFALIILDIDHFKSFNDRFGHLAGDFMLRAFARELDERVRPLDIPTRYGGEEFVVVLPQTTVAEARDVAERILIAVRAAEYSYEGNTHRMTVSAGVAGLSELPETRLQPEALVDLADRRLYVAKVTGRDRVVWQDNLSQASG